MSKVHVGPATCDLASAQALVRFARKFDLALLTFSGAVVVACTHQAPFLELLVVVEIRTGRTAIPIIYVVYVFGSERHPVFTVAMLFLESDPNLESIAEKDDRASRACRSFL